jgi:O-Antigen ligase
MSSMRRITGEAIIPAAPSANPGAPGVERGSRSGSQGTVAVAFVVLLLILATTSQGAFAVSRWAPLALFALSVLFGALLVRGGLMVRNRCAIAALAGIWGLAALSLLSMLWAGSAASSFQGGDRMLLYAVIATLPLVLPAPRRALAFAGWAITAGIGVIAVFVLIGLLIDGGPLFLAGRLNAPINYRNATALLFALAVLPCVVAAAARSYRRGVRAAALALATLCLGLVFLTQSRGILLGLGAGEIVILALGPDRVRRAWVSLVPLAIVALSSKWLLRPFHAFDGGSGFVSVHDITVAARALLIATAASFALGLVIALFDAGVRANSPQLSHLRRAARIGLALGGVVALVGIGAAIGNPVTYLRQKWDQFSSLQSTTPTSTRLLTVGGQRYDLWRVAIKEFEAHPLLGVGTDNYASGYYRYRANDRNLDDPHSLLFAVLAENGAVGIALLLLFLGGIAGALWTGWRRLDDAARRPAVAAAATGAVLIGQSTVDWIWLIPGLTAIGIFSLGLAAAQAGTVTRPAPPVGRRSFPPSRVGRPAAAGAVALALFAVLALFLSDAYIQRARSAIADPAAELSAARTAAVLDPWSVTPHYLEASALETSGDRPAAYAQLLDALALEPSNSATLGVLGDFEARGHRFALARSYYRRALALDPLDTGLQQLARVGLKPATAGHVGRARHR